MPWKCLYCETVADVAPAGCFCPFCGEQISKPAKQSKVPAVELIDVCKSFNENDVLRGLSLKVPQGECLVIVGMSGSGKSVLLENIIGFQQPDRGQVCILGTDISTPQALQTVQANIGMVFQGSALIDSLSVIDNVTLPLVAHAVPYEEAVSKANPLLDAVGLTAAEMDRMPAQLSGGMQKRVGISRALISQPKILLYDEPTTGLDAATSQRISQLICDLQNRHAELASIVITHDYLSAGFLADRVLYLDKNSGQLQEVLSKADIHTIHSQYPHQPQEAVAVIREQLETFFNQLQLDDQSVSNSAPVQPWGDAFWNVFSATFDRIGQTVLLLSKVGFPHRQALLFARFYEIFFKSLAVACSAGAFFGMLLVVQIAMGLQGSGLLEPLPRIVGSALVEKVGPLIVGLLLAGRIAASVGAEMGGKRISRQFDAFRAMGIAPESYWMTPIFWASIIALPLLTIALEIAACGGALVLAVFKFHIKGSFFIHNVLSDVTLWGFLFGLIRSTVFGAAVALVGYTRGAAIKRSSDEVGQDTTVAVVEASLTVIILDFIMTFVASY